MFVWAECTTFEVPKSGTSFGNAAKYWVLTAQCFTKVSPSDPIWSTACPVSTIYEAKNSSNRHIFFLERADNNANLHPPASHLYPFRESNHCCYSTYTVYEKIGWRLLLIITPHTILSRPPRRHSPLPSASLTGLISSSCLILPIALMKMAALANWHWVFRLPLPFPITLSV